MKGLILAGGSGTRLRPLTHTNAKQLIPVGNKPILFYAIEDVVAAGITDIAIIVGHTKEEVKKAVGDGGRWGAKITYIEQDAPRGLAHAASIAKDFMSGEPFVMYLGDNLLAGGIKKMAKDFEKSDAEAAIALVRVPDPQRFGVAKFDAQGNLAGLVEKPKEPPSDMALVGIYFFRKSIFDCIARIKPSWRNELEITDAIDCLLADGKKVATHTVTGWFKDTGKPEDIIDANRLVLEGMKKDVKGSVMDGAKISGRVALGEGSVVGAGCRVRGPCAIGRNVRISDGARVGPNVSIGDNCTISKARLSDSVVMEDSVISCKKKLVGCLVAKNVKIEDAKEKNGGAASFVVGDGCTICV